MKKIIFRNCFVRLAGFTVILALLVCSPGISTGGAVKKLTVSEINEKVTLLYIDALNFNTEGEYQKASAKIEEIMDLLKSSPYVRTVRNKLEIQPDEVTLQVKLFEFKDAQKNYQKAKKAFTAGDYALAQELFLDLQKASPQNEEVQKYLPQAEDMLAKQRKKEEELLAKQAQLKVPAGESSDEQKIKAGRETLKRSDILEKTLEDEVLKKQRQDRARVERIDKLWQEARALYSKRMYEEAIKAFQEVVQLEGNPRIKYTPFAKEYIEKAKEKIDEQKIESTSKEVEHMDKAMINEVLKRQVPPYIEPPLREEAVEQAPLIEPPLIRKKLKKKISMDFDKVGLKSVILFLSKESGVNIITSQTVLNLGIKVSARFNDAPVDEVIKYITKSQGLVYRIDKDLVWIAHPEEIAKEALETRIYYLSKGGGLFTEFSPITSGGTETSLGGSSAQITKILTIEDTLKETVPWPADAKLTYDKRINALIVRNTPQNLQMLEDILYNLDIAPYQILIEARFLEVDITDTKELGLEWKLNADFPVQEKRGGIKTGIGKDSGLDFSSFTRAAEGLNFTYKGVLSQPQFQTVLHALEETKKIKTLSSPRITTLNNQMATIKVVDEWIYPTRYEYEVIQVDLNGDGDFSDPGETTYKNVPKDFLRRDVGILLKVIPSVGQDKKTVSLSLIPEVSEATPDFFTYTGDVKLPKFTSRNLSTTVVVTSGDTVVLGGLIKESRTKTVTKVPILGDIPWLGELFKKNADSVERKNLLIFVTAKVLSPSGEEIVMTSKEKQ